MINVPAYSATRDMTDEQLTEVLESVIDRRSLSFVLSKLAEVCYGKAEHASESGGSNADIATMERMWEDAGHVCATAADRKAIHNVSSW